MKLSFITDEVTQDLPQAIAFAQRHSLQGVELRSVQDLPIDQIPPAVLKQWSRQLRDSGLTVCNLASSFFKCAPEDAPKELEKLYRLCDAADLLGCSTIRGFAFFAPASGPQITQQLLDAFQAPIDLLGQRGKRLLLEADPSVNTTNHAALAALLQTLHSPQLGAIYDPGNDIYDPQGEIPYPNGYEAIRPFLAHIHIKDAILTPDGPQCVCVGTGLVDYKGLLQALSRDGYDGFLSLETHYRKAACLTEEQLRLPQGSAFSRGGEEATAESIAALCRLCKECRL